MVTWMSVWQSQALTKETSAGDQHLSLLYMPSNIKTLELGCVCQTYIFLSHFPMPTIDFWVCFLHKHTSNVVRLVTYDDAETVLKMLPHLRPVVGHQTANILIH